MPARALTLAALTVACLAAAAGCSSTAKSDTRLAYRVANVANTVGVIEDGEVVRPQKLDQTVRTWSRVLDEDARKTARHPALIDQYYRFEFKRWNDRQPFYRRMIEGMLAGHPEQIESNAIILFY